MPQGDKSKYTDKQIRQAEHIEEGYRERGLPEDEAERRAWATVNATYGGGEKPGGGGYGKPVNKRPARRGGRIGGKRAASARRSRSRIASARRGGSARRRLSTRPRTGSSRRGSRARRARR